MINILENSSVSCEIWGPHSSAMSIQVFWNITPCLQEYSFQPFDKHAVSTFS